MKCVNAELALKMAKLPETGGFGKCLLDDCDLCFIRVFGMYVEYGRCLDELTAPAHTQEPQSKDTPPLPFKPA